MAKLPDFCRHTADSTSVVTVEQAISGRMDIDTVGVAIGPALEKLFDREDDRAEFGIGISRAVGIAEENPDMELKELIDATCASWPFNERWDRKARLAFEMGAAIGAVEVLFNREQKRTDTE